MEGVHFVMENTIALFSLSQDPFSCLQMPASHQQMPNYEVPGCFEGQGLIRGHSQWAWWG